ncbi:uncharacterized protein UTRI_05979 [Ustilago trichophora]|uniref:Uncharacterized protein n=1 Tax=Ustilago trichophora TaxID=86804 RepID=A0A5C3EIT6_9BASI|nr:uncharacterized protein UTRI_05979 [Ustilago trichophora]
MAPVPLSFSFSFSLSPQFSAEPSKWCRQTSYCVAFHFRDQERKSTSSHNLGADGNSLGNKKKKKRERESQISPLNGIVHATLQS